MESLKLGSSRSGLRSDTKEEALTKRSGLRRLYGDSW